MDRKTEPAGAEPAKAGQPSDVKKLVARRVREARLAKGLSIEQAAAALSLTPGQIEKYERGENQIHAARLYEFSRLYVVDVGTFFDEAPKD